MTSRTRLKALLLVLLVLVAAALVALALHKDPAPRKVTTSPVVTTAAASPTTTTTTTAPASPTTTTTEARAVTTTTAPRPTVTATTAPVRVAPTTTTTTRPRPTPTTTAPKRTTNPALPNVGTDYGYAMPPGNPKVLRDGFVNCDLPNAVAYVKFATGYSELFTAKLVDGSWTLPVDYEGTVLPNTLVVNDQPGQTSQGITHTAGADGCVIWPAPGQPGYVGGTQPTDPNSPS